MSLKTKSTWLACAVALLMGGTAQASELDVYQNQNLGYTNQMDTKANNNIMFKFNRNNEQITIEPAVRAARPAFTPIRVVGEDNEDSGVSNSGRINPLDVDKAFQANIGRHSPYGSVGCAETVTAAGSYYSKDLKDEYNKGIASVPGLIQDLAAKGFAVEPFNGYANKGDLLVYGDDDHVVIADGHGGCFGNSSSRLQALHYGDAAYAWCNGELPSKIIRMS